MKKLVWTLIILLLPLAAHASSITVVNPSDDGSFYTCSGCNPSPNRAYVHVAGYIVGDVKFPTTQFQGRVTSATLSVNPYGLPLWNPQIDVYGAGSSSSTISLLDLNSPAFLGTWTLPAGLDFGQDAFFDVTAFLQNVHTPFVAFVLRAPSGGGGDIFSSQQHNYGHASQLTVTIPEPASFVLISTGAAALGWRKRHRINGRA